MPTNSSHPINEDTRAQRERAQRERAQRERAQRERAQRTGDPYSLRAGIVAPQK